MILNPSQADQILILLGFGSNLRQLSDAQIMIVRQHLEQDFPDELVDRVTQIQASLVTVETQLAEALEYAFVDSSNRFKLNSRQAISLLNSRGAALLEELANLLDIPIRLNRYRPQSSTQVSYW
jgi:hypothetical protein